GTTWASTTSATIAAGTTSILVRTPIVDDALNETSENFSLTATRTAGASTNVAASGIATIVDNDGAPQITINNATVNEAAGTGTILDNGGGTGGTDNDTPTLSVSSPNVTEGTDPYAVFTVSLSNASATPISFNLALANGTATGSGTDFGPGLEVSTDGGSTW